MASNPYPSEHREWLPNLMGAGAIVLWSSSVAFSRVVTEALGVVATTGCEYFIGGALLCAIETARSRGLHRFRHIPRPYLIVCGALFVGYTGCFLGGIGLAADRRQAVEVSMLNYLWPALVVVFSVPILGYRARWRLLLPGICVGLAGTACVLGGQVGLSLAGFLAGVRSSPLAYLLGLLAGVTWGLYSNLVRRLSDPRTVSGTPLFTLATGVVFLACLAFCGTERIWSWRVAGAVAYLAVVTVAVGYVFWEIAMKRGNVVLLGSLSFFTPVLSTVISCLLLHVRFGADLLVGCALVTAGAWVCRFSVERPKKPVAPRDHAEDSPSDGQSPPQHKETTS